jgi:hypothetical protein
VPLTVNELTLIGVGAGATASLAGVFLNNRLVGRREQAQERREDRFRLFDERRRACTDFVLCLQDWDRQLPRHLIAISRRSDTLQDLATIASRLPEEKVGVLLAKMEEVTVARKALKEEVEAAERKARIAQSVLEIIAEHAVARAASAAVLVRSLGEFRVSVRGETPEAVMDDVTWSFRRLILEIHISLDIVTDQDSRARLEEARKASEAEWAGAQAMIDEMLVDDPLTHRIEKLTEDLKRLEAQGIEKERPSSS